MRMIKKMMMRMRLNMRRRMRKRQRMRTRARRMWKRLWMTCAKAKRIRFAKAMRIRIGAPPMDGWMDGWMDARMILDAEDREVTGR